jgi:hypothetical protein
MSASPAPDVPVASPVADVAHPTRDRLCGWFASFLVHVALLLLLERTVVTGLGMTAGAPDGEEHGEYRAVGLRSRDSLADAEPRPEADPVDDGNPTAEPLPTLRQAGPERNALELSSVPPVPLSLPDSAVRTLGPGGQAPTAASATAGAPTDVVRPGGARAVGELAAATKKGVSFLGLRDSGTRFVYVLDASGSMRDYNAIRYAKMHLVSSLAGLEPTQMFQILFYNQSVRMLRLGDDARPQLYYATSIHQTLAGQFIEAVQPDLGTDHMAALRKALSLKAEALFLLTDADEPVLQAADLDEIRRTNAGRTRIHCVAFGVGPELHGDNFLKRLAGQNGGGYRYVDVRSIGREPGRAGALR